MKLHPVNRRQFIRTSAALAGAATLSPWGVWDSRAAAVKRTATDQVTLGKTGVKLSRLGIGTGINNGEDQVILGKDEWIKLIHYAYDQGITYFDCAQRYKTFEWMGDAIKDLPREKLYIQSKVWGQPEDVLGTIDHHRKTFKTDYVDSLLIHCMTDGAWVDKWKRIRDGFDEAKEKKWIRIRGVSCHSLPALSAAAGSEWPEVHLVRVNPEGNHMDASQQVAWSNGGVDVSPVVKEIKTMHEKGHGVIGMKIFGNGDFTKPEQREKSIRFAMANKDIDAIVIGFTQAKEIDEAIERMNRALAEG
jgi:predicted aldo/keto reductase-like oxidoreductase